MDRCVRAASDLQEPKMWIQVAGAEESVKHIVNELRASNVLVIIVRVYILSLGVQRAPREQYVKRVTGRVRVIVRGTNCRHALIGLRMILVNLYLVEEGQGGARLIEKKSLVRKSTHWLRGYRKQHCGFYLGRSCWPQMHLTQSL